jgi:hypothetical protein
MATIGRRVRVQDYASFRAVYDAGTAARENGGFPNELILRNPRDPNDILIITQVADVVQAQAYGQSEEVRERQRASGLLELTNYYPE